MAKDAVREQFDVYHEANKPGCRVEDVYGACIIRDKMDAPKKDERQFQTVGGGIQGMVGQ